MSRSDQEFRVEAGSGLRLDQWLADPSRLGSRRKAAEALARGRIFLDDQELTPRDGGRTLEGGERIRIWLDRPGSAKAKRDRRGPPPLPRVFEDDDLIVVDKPAGLFTVPRDGREGRDRSVISRLSEEPTLRGRDLRVVHRIDRDTSGLVIVAKHREAQRALQEQFLARTPTREYIAIATATPDTGGEWHDELLDDPKVRIARRARPGERRQEAISRVTIEEEFPDGSCLLRVALVTGRRNQIRIQAALRGAPLFGETLYSAGKPASSPFRRLALHAARLVFEHPRTKKPLDCISALPADLAAGLERWRGAR